MFIYIWDLFYLPYFRYFTAQQHSVCRQAEQRSVTADDLYHGLKVVQPSAMKELAIEKPNVREWMSDSYFTLEVVSHLLTLLAR